MARVGRQQNISCAPQLRTRSHTSACTRVALEAQHHDLADDDDFGASLWRSGGSETSGNQSEGDAWVNYLNRWKWSTLQHG